MIASTVVGQPSRLPLVHWPSRLVVLQPGRPKDGRQAGRLPHSELSQCDNFHPYGAMARKTQQPLFVFGLEKKERPVVEVLVVTVNQVVALVLHCTK